MFTVLSAIASLGRKCAALLGIDGRGTEHAETLHVGDHVFIVLSDLFGSIPIQRHGEVVGVCLVDDRCAPYGWGDLVTESVLEILHLLAVDAALSRYRARDDRQQRDLDAKRLLDDRQFV